MIEELEYYLKYFRKHSSSPVFRVLENLTSDVIRESNRLGQNKRDIVILALSCRNIFELYLISRNVLEDGENMNNWLYQMDKDDREIKDGLLALVESRGLKSDEVRSMLNEHERFSDSLGIPPKGPFQVKNMAEKFGFLADYNSIFKLSSKLLHPSSVKVNSYNALTETDDYFSVLRLATQHFIELFIKHCQSIEYYHVET